MANDKDLSLQGMAELRERDPEFARKTKNET